jgi:carboxypeptidase PM20D1
MFKYVTYSILGLILIISAVVLVRTSMLQPLPEAVYANIKIPKIDINTAAQNLSRSIQFKTISTYDNNKENADSFEQFHEFLHKTYPTVFSKLQLKEFPPFGILLKWEGKNPELKPIMLMAHQDVVPISPNSEGSWKHPPFSGAIVGGVIWGRGSLDDKGSLIAIMEAVSDLIKEGYTPNRTTYLFFSDKEEILGETAKKVASYFKENNIRLEAVFDEGGFILADAFKEVNGPVVAIGLSEKGYLDLELSASSLPGHTAIPHGQTTVAIISKAISKLDEDPFPVHINGFRIKTYETLASHMSFFDKLPLANMWLFEPFIIRFNRNNPLFKAVNSTTSAASMFTAGVRPNILPPEAKAIVNFRIIHGETVESVIEHVQQTIDDPRIALKKLIEVNPSHFSSQDTPAYKAITKIVNVLYPDIHPVFAPFTTLGVTDSRNFADVSDNQYRFLAALESMSELAGFHGTDERLSIDNLGKMIQFYMLLIKEFH